MTASETKMRPRAVFSALRIFFFSVIAVRIKSQTASRRSHECLQTYDCVVGKPARALHQGADVDVNPMTRRPNKLICKDRRIDPHSPALLRPNRVPELFTRVFRVVAGVLDNLSHAKSINQVRGRSDVAFACLTRCKEPEPVTGFELPVKSLGAGSPVGVLRLVPRALLRSQRRFVAPHQS